MAMLTPRQIVNELDRYIVGQDEAKRAVAVALRNRYRRKQLPEEIREEVTPKNILMIGPTGVGKTEIARRLAKLVTAPFVKVEATKFTEVGYVGRDVDSIIRDLVEASIRMVKDTMVDMTGRPPYSASIPAPAKPWICWRTQTSPSTCCWATHSARAPKRPRRRKSSAPRAAKCALRWKRAKWKSGW